MCMSNFAQQTSCFQLLGCKSKQKRAVFPTHRVLYHIFTSANTTSIYTTFIYTANIYTTHTTTALRPTSCHQYQIFKGEERRGVQADRAAG